MLGGSGSDQLFAGAGSDTLTGGAGSDIFAFFNSTTIGKANVITDFSSQDSLYVIGYDSTSSASALQNAAVVSAAGVTITLSDNTSITFSNLTSASQLDGKILYGG
jgi:Ca2+-binding RTX toxin-like protein